MYLTNSLADDFLCVNIKVHTHNKDSCSVIIALLHFYLEETNTWKKTDLPSKDYSSNAKNNKARESQSRIQKLNLCFQSECLGLDYLCCLLLLPIVWSCRIQE